MNAASKRISEQGGTFDAVLIHDFLGVAFDHAVVQDARGGAALRACRRRPLSPLDNHRIFAADY